MSDDQFTKLFKYIEKRFDTIETELASKADRKDLDRVYGALDTVLKNQETDQQERLAMNAQLDRHDTWIHLLAQNTNLKLSHE